MSCIWKVEKEDRECDFCTFVGCDERPKLASETVMNKISQMSVGDAISFPVIKWSSCRTAASVLKKVFGAEFRVNRISNAILVERIS